MQPTATKAEFTRAGFEAFLATRDEPEWLISQRRALWQAFEEAVWPSTQDEEWRRTDIRMFRLERFGLPFEPLPEAVTPPPLLARGVELAGAHHTLNSRTTHSRLEPEWAARGVRFGSLDAQVREAPDLVQSRLFTRAVDPYYDKFAALHGACWSGGTLLYVPRGVNVAPPLHVVTSLARGGVDLGHTLVVLEEGAEATLLVETCGDDEEALHCGGIEVLLERGARLRLVSLQEWGAKTWHFAHQKAVLGAGAKLQWTIGALGGKLAKVNQHVLLAGERAEAQVNGVMFTEGRQHFCYHTLQHHAAPHCTSDLLYKGALQDRSRVVWRGMIKVDPDAQRTNGYQRNDNLLLAEQARADSIPGLEIEADDVICTHGATAGRVDDELIFYAQCRGLTRNEAVRAIVAGFFQQVFDRIPLEGVREALSAAIGRRIRNYD